jgi:hypothetical protein
VPQILLGCVEGSQGNMAAFPGSLALIDGGSGQSTLVPNANGLLHVEWCVVLFCLKGFLFQFSVRSAKRKSAIGLGQPVSDGFVSMYLINLTSSIQTKFIGRLISGGNPSIPPIFNVFFL